MGGTDFFEDVCMRNTSNNSMNESTIPLPLLTTTTTTQLGGLFPHGKETPWLFAGALVIGALVICALCSWSRSQLDNEATPAEAKDLKPLTRHESDDVENMESGA